jgi:hypothetical protein
MGTVNGTIAEGDTFSRDESIRLVTECLGLESGRDKALTFKECSDVNATEFKLVKGLREGGYSRPQEIDHMISKGPAVSVVLCRRTRLLDWILACVPSTCVVSFHFRLFTNIISQCISFILSKLER